MFEVLDCTIPGNLEQVNASHVRDMDHVMCSELSPSAETMAKLYVIEKRLKIKSLEAEHRPKVKHAFFQEEELCPHGL